MARILAAEIFGIFTRVSLFALIVMKKVVPATDLVE